MPHPTPRPLHAEPLEGRELPSAVTETFRRSPTEGLPGGWTQWSSDRTAVFQTDPTADGADDTGTLTAAGLSSTVGRAWLSAPFAADVQSSAAVYLNSNVPVQLVVRGKGLDTTRPSYYAAAVSRGAEVSLVKVVDGQTTVLGGVRTADYLSNRWVTLTVQAEGDAVRAYLHRGDTNQYLSSDGSWTNFRTAAVAVTDGSLPNGGVVGFNRPAGSGDPISLDSLRVEPPTADEPPTGTGLPAGWSQWAKGGTVAADDGEVVFDGDPTADARAWPTTPTAADGQVSASLYLNGSTPAGLFARGQAVGTDQPSYYTATVGSGPDVRLWRVIDGTPTELGRVPVRGSLSGAWVQVTLDTTGDWLRAQVFRPDTEQYLRDDGTWGSDPAWAITRTDDTLTAGGVVGLSRSPGQAGPLRFDNFVVTANTSAPAPTPSPSTPPDAPSGLPAVHRSYPHIRLANLAYWGTPFDDTTTSLLTHGVDLVVPNLAYLDDVAAANPDTPQFVYTNLSNIYLNLITDWNSYADRRGLNRESAFLHVTKATPLTGSSASSVPVDRFWGVYRGAGSDWQDITRDATHTGDDLRFADAGQSVAFGFIEKFREINVDLKQGGRDGWAAGLEYVSKVDGDGNPTEWKPLRTLADATGGLARDGKLTFDPPADWQTASVGGSARLYYVRFRTTHDGTAPVAATVLGRDYTAGGVIPAFDAAADRNGDGYLSDAEYAKRAKGMDARFRYESRLTYPQYGPMRFATNVGDSGFRAWAADYHQRFLKDQPLAAGFFVDNSIGRLAVDQNAVAEDLSTYAADYGSLLGGLDRTLRQSGKWLLANTSGGGRTAEPIAAAGVSTLEEFALRPLAASHVQLDDLMATLAVRRELSAGRGYEVLDSLPTDGFDATDPRVELATLAMYYVVADPAVSMLMVNGGNEPNSSWERHFIPASTVDVGKPLGAATVVDSGLDPSDSSLVYKVYGRQYENALVLYKPRSYTRGAVGGLGDATATTYQLDGQYRPVAADGTVGQPVRSVTLRNGEGAVLLKA